MYLLNQKEYCFISSRNKKVPSRVSQLGLHTCFRKKYDDINIFYLADNNQNTPRFAAVINDQKDYSLNEILQMLLNGKIKDSLSGDSLLSVAIAGESRFACMTDFWGINTHYWVHHKDTFICASNIFFISKILELPLSETACYEYLFFSSPLYDKTWFENVYTLLPGQQLIFDYSTFSVELSEPKNLFEELMSDRCSIHELLEVVDTFYKRAGQLIEKDEASVSLSAGSDSRSVLAGVRGHKIGYRCYSFGIPGRQWETEDILKFVAKYDIPLKLVSLEDVARGWKTAFRRGTIVTSGLLNPFRTHYIKLYDAIPPGSAIFEGIFASEFIKAKEASGTMTSREHLEVIQGRTTLGKLLKERYTWLKSTALKSMTEYLVSKYASSLRDVNTPVGFRYYQEFLLGFIPQRIFAPLIKLAGEQHPLYFPYLSPRILKCVFGNQAGLAVSVDKRNDWPGYVKSIILLAHITKHLDIELFNSILDKNISFREALIKPRAPVVVLRKVRSLYKKWRYRGLFRGQIDNSDINRNVLYFVRNSKFRNGPINYIEVPNTPYFAGRIANLDIIYTLAR